MMVIPVAVALRLSSSTVIMLRAERFTCSCTTTTKRRCPKHAYLVCRMKDHHHHLKIVFFFVKKIQWKHSFIGGYIVYVQHCYHYIMYGIRPTDLATQWPAPRVRCLKRVPTCCCYGYGYGSRPWMSSEQLNKSLYFLSARIRNWKWSEVIFLYHSI